MSFTLIQEPTNPNAAYTRLLYTYSGSIYTGQPQFQYICDVYVSGSTNIIKRMTQPVNPTGTVTFDVSRIIQGELSADYNWKINTPTPLVGGNNKGRKIFKIKGGEQFGTSISSSVTVYPDQDISTLTAFQGVIEPNAGTYNWESLPPQPIILSNMPTTMSMQPDDYGTITYTTNITTYISQSFYSSSEAGALLVDEKNYTIPISTPYVFTEVPISSSNQNWNYVDVSISDSTDEFKYRYEASDETHREKTRFAFINKLGAWDYYNNYNPVRQAINVSREQYTAPRVDYSSRVSTYDISRRGKKDYHNSTDDIFTVDTDLLDKTNANWLEELIESPEVYIQRNGEFIPIVITDSSYVANQNQARQKLFQYTINFKPSNQPFGTWIPEYVSCPPVSEGPTVVVTDAATNINSSSATLNGQVSNDGGVTTERGFVYAPYSTTPTIELDFKVVEGSGEGLYSSSINSLTTGSNISYRAYASNSLGLVYGDVEEFTLLGDLVLPEFNPYAGGIATSSLMYWYDFTDSGSMTLTASLEGGTNGIGAIQSKGEEENPSGQKITLAKGSDLSTFIPPTYEGYFTQFSSTRAGSTDNGHGKLSSDYGNYTTSLNGFTIGSTTTAIIFSEVTFEDPTKTNLINYQENDGSANHFANYSLLATRNSNTAPGFTGSFISSASSYISASGAEFKNPDAFHGVYYSYSGSTSPATWESRFVKYDDSSGYTITSGRTPSETVASQSVLSISTGGAFKDFLTIGGDSAPSSTDMTPFKLSHFLYYTGSLTNDQINAVINSFTGSVPFGYRVNKISN